MKFRTENHSFRTEGTSQFIDVTGDVLGVLERSEVQNGLALVYSPHTTCSIVVNERESGFIHDFRGLIDELVPPTNEYVHDDLTVRTENLEDDPHEDPNGHAHCKSALLGSASQALPVVNGRLQLGRWQRVFFVELDRARDRKVFIQVMGV